LKYAPIIVFAFNRPTHLRKTLAALSSCPESSGSDLIVFVDGPRSIRDLDLVSQTVKVAQAAVGFRNLDVRTSQVNKGLANSIITGVSDVINRLGKVIVLEDDIIVSSAFLTYCNSALEKYEFVPEVASVHGYSLPLNPQITEPYFIRGADCWGWATWKDRWESIEWDPEVLLSYFKGNRKLSKQLDLSGSYPYLKMLKDQSKGLVDSWAIRWHVSMFLQNRLTLYPGVSLVRNIGLDGSGTHGNNRQDFQVDVAKIPPMLGETKPVESELALGQIVKFFQDARSIRRRLALRISSLFGP
jgi:hypothetical protein